MNACLQFNAPGIGGPEDAPEYDGPTIDELVAQKMHDPNFFQGATGYLGAEVYQAAADGDAEAFLARFLFECRKLAARQAAEELGVV